MTREQLAREYLSVLALEKEYDRVRTPAAHADVCDAKRRLRQRCQDVLHPPAPPRPTLFGGDREEG